MQVSSNEPELLVSESKQQTTDGAQPHGQPIAKNDVYKTEGQGAGNEHAPAGAEQRLVAMKEESAV